MSASKEELEKARFFFELALRSDQVIEKANERLTEKIRGVFGIASTLIPIVVGLGYFILRETKFYWVFAPIFFSIIMFLLAIGRGIMLQKPTGFLFVDPLTIMMKHKKKSLRYIINKTALTWSDNVFDNSEVINSKENGLNQMLILITVGLVILALSFLGLAISIIN